MLFVPNRLHSLLLAALVVSATAGAANDPGFGINDPADLTVWPNKSSNANSDAWIVKNHDQLKKMKPRVLVLNFANGFEREQVEKKAQQLAKALTEGTRYHGYKDPDAPAFIEWQIFRIVELTDPKPYPKTPDDNSTNFPRNGHTGIPNFAYKELYTRSRRKAGRDNLN